MTQTPKGGRAPPRETASGEPARTVIRAFVRTLEKVTAGAKAPPKPKPARKDIPP